MRVTDLTVAGARIRCVLAFEEGEPLRTSQVPDLARRVLEALPGLKGHRCDTPGAVTFADELSDTEIAHLVEHAALELAAMAGSPDTLRGETSWDFARDGQGVFAVSLEFDDADVVASAVREAADAASLLVTGRDMDAGAAVSRLRRVRGRSSRTP